MRSMLGLLGIVGSLFLMGIPAPCPAITLDEALDSARLHNPSLHQQHEQITAQKAAFGAEISPENPHIFVEYDDIPKTGALSAYGHRKIGFAQALEFPLTYFLRGKQAQLKIEQEKIELLQLQNTIETQVKIEFYEALMLEKQHALMEELVNLSRQIMDKAVIRVNTGEAAPYEALKAQVDLAAAENKLLAFKQRQENTRLNLARLLGMSAQTPVIPEGELIFEPVSLNPESLLAFAEERHPDVRLAELNIAGQKLHQKQTRTDVIPIFEIRFFQTENTSEANATTYGGEFGFSIPLWAPLKNRSAIRQARYLTNAAEWHRKEVGQKIRFQLQKALNQLETATRQMSSFQENSLQQSRELQRIVTRSYEEGEMSYLEVTEALRSIITIKTGYLEAIFNCLTAEAVVMRAIGGMRTENIEQRGLK